MARVTRMRMAQIALKLPPTHGWSPGGSYLHCWCSGPIGAGGPDFAFFLVKPLLLGPPPADGAALLGSQPAVAPPLSAGRVVANPSPYSGTVWWLAQAREKRVRCTAHVCAVRLMLGVDGAVCQESDPTCGTGIYKCFSVKGAYL